MRPVPAITQGALYSMANAACRDNTGTSVRFNEVYLAMRVEVDSVAEQTGTHKASDFAAVYEQILARPEIRSCRVTVASADDFKDLKFAKKEWIPPAGKPAGR